MYFMQLRVHSCIIIVAVEFGSYIETDELCSEDSTGQGDRLAILRFLKLITCFLDIILVILSIGADNDLHLGDWIGL